MKRLVVFLLTLTMLLSAAWAAIGEEPETILTLLAPLEPTPAGGGVYTTARGTSFTLEERNGLVYRASGTAVLDEAGVIYTAAIIGAATGFGEALAGPLSEFLTNRVGELSGEGQVRLAVEHFWLELDVTGAAAPYTVAFAVQLQEIPAESLPTSPHALGPADARYVIREFSDFQCPFCARFHAEGLPLIRAQLLPRGDVRYEFHHFPLLTIHPNAVPAAEASECVTAANNAEAFWTFTDALFERQQAWASLGDPNPYFVRLAGEIGLATEGVAECLTERRYLDVVGDAYEVAGGTLGLRGTPSVFVNGYRVNNMYRIEEYLEAIRLIDAFGQ